MSFTSPFVILSRYKVLCYMKMIKKIKTHDYKIIDNPRWSFFVLDWTTSFSFFGTKFVKIVQKQPNIINKLQGYQNLFMSIRVYKEYPLKKASKWICSSSINTQFYSNSGKPNTNLVNYQKKSFFLLLLQGFPMKS